MPAIHHHRHLCVVPRVSNHGPPQLPFSCSSKQSLKILSIPTCPYSTIHSHSKLLAVSPLTLFLAIGLVGIKFYKPPFLLMCPNVFISS